MNVAVKPVALALLLFAGWPAAAFAAGPFQAFDTIPSSGLAVQGTLQGAKADAAPENRRAVAIGLAVLLGPFGAHRLYLGTSAKVPIVYGLTFGGFGVLVLIDLAHLLLRRDLGPFQDNDHVLMWSGAAATPP